MTKDQVFPKSNQTVWWYQKYYDPVLERQFEFEWKTSISSRTSKNLGCPFLSGKSIWPGFNDLATRFPSVAKEWDYEKNGDLTPEQVMPFSMTKVWWIISYTDPDTGKTHTLSWQAAIASRTKGIGCPYLSNKKVLKGVNDLATTHPHLAAQWHPTKNGNLSPEMVSYGSSQTVWWYLEHYDNELDKTFQFEWETSVNARTSKDTGCPYLMNKAVWKGYNDLQTRYPEIAREWDYEKNGDLTPDKIVAASNMDVWWKIPYTDPLSGKAFCFSWRTSVSNRTVLHTQCPYLTSTALYPGFNDLASRYPEVAAQWHPTRNGKLKPDQVFPFDKRSVWWLYPYDDPKTGRHFDFEWKATVAKKVGSKYGCPYLTNDAVWPGYNDLATTHPEIAAQWHPTKNGDLTPQMVTYGSNQLVWWLYPYDDPRTGRHFDFEWSGTVAVRVDSICDCPYLTNDAVWPGYNDLATTHPEIAAQWHPTKNGELKPEQVTAGSRKLVWWLYPYDDPCTGKHFNFEWQAVIENRAIGENSCPYLTNTELYNGFNDLATRYPEVAAQWHPTKNGELKPDQVFPSDQRNVWWLYPYDDPNTGKYFNFEWSSTVAAKVGSKYGCPYLTNDAVWVGFNDLATTHPEAASHWHPAKNGDLTPEMVTYGSGIEVWWLYPYDDPDTGKHFGFEWSSTVAAKVGSKYGCPYLTNDAVWVGYNDLATTHPEAASHWHPTKNGNLTPEMVTYGSGIEVWWLYPYDDPNTGKHFDFEWSGTVAAKVGSKYGCQYLTNDAVWVGFNDLATTHPEAASHWHPAKNGDLTPEMVTYGSNQTVWWLYPYDDQDTGKHFNFEWVSTVAAKVGSKYGCPYLTNDAVWVGYNDLATTHPEVAAQWHPNKNGNLTPEMVTYGSNQTVWWLYPYDDPNTGRHFNFEWSSTVAAKGGSKYGCPYLTNDAVWVGYNDLATTHPEITVHWHPIKNGSLTPEMVTYGSNQTVWWLYPYDDPNTGKHFDFEWSSTVTAKVGSKYGCPYLTNDAVWVGFNDLSTTHPEVASQWHPTKNGNLTPETVTAGSNQLAWWYLPYTDPSTGKTHYFEWVRTVTLKVRSLNECPYTAGHAVWTGYNDLHACFPDIAEQWSEKNRFLKPDRVYKFSKMKAWWKCPVCGIEWRTSVNSRTTRGTGCPKCAIAKRKLLYPY